MGCYIVPDDASNIESVVTAIGQQTYREELLLSGDFNAEFAAPEGNACDEDIDTALATADLEDMNAHLLPWHKSWLREGRTWSMFLRG